MIGQSVKLTTIRGIEVGVHYSWFIIFFSDYVFTDRSICVGASALDAD